MSHDQYCRLQDIANTLIDARDELEMLELEDVRDANALHGIISQAYWLCTRICQTATTEQARVAADVKCTRANHGLILPRVVMTAWPNEIQRKAALEDLKQRCFTETSIRS
jgi:hypothetical protein